MARFCDRRSNAVYAGACQERALALLGADDDETQQRRSVLLFNHAGYLANAGHLNDAVAALEAVVAIDEALGLDDLESDRAALQRMRQRRAGGGESVDDFDLAAAVQQQLAQLSLAENVPRWRPPWPRSSSNWRSCPQRNKPLCKTAWPPTPSNGRPIRL